MINLVVSLPIRRDPGVLMNVAVPEHRAINNQILRCGKVYFHCVGKIEFDSSFSKPFVRYVLQLCQCLTKPLIKVVWLVIPTDVILNLT